MEQHQALKTESRRKQQNCYSVLPPDALRDHAIKNLVEKTVSFPYGVRYVVEGELPDERNPLVRSVWIIETGQELPRLVTAYPL